MKEKNVFQKHFQLAQLRARLSQAMDEGNAAQIYALSQQIDDCQMKLWKEEKEKQQIV